MNICRSSAFGYSVKISLWMPNFEWIATQVNIEVFSPDIPFGISLQFNPEDILLNECINDIVIPHDYEADPYWKSPVGHSRAVTRQLVFGQFVRKFHDKNFSDWKMPRYWSKDSKQVFNCQAEVVGQIWRLVKLLPSSQKPRPLFFKSIILDYALVLCDSFSEEEQEVTATEWVKKQQAINRKLHTQNNPFDPKTKPETWQFIEQAREEAERNPSFSKDYAKLIRARMAMITTLKNSHQKKIDQTGKAKEKRGRKPKNGGES
jgi:hypothetical protein